MDITKAFRYTGKQLPMTAGIIWRKRRRARSWLLWSDIV